ncbi:MAG TPA: 6-bladed beta-propeller [Gemmatimonadaceae bacterium]|nr:6-bladed beta-propeller [Gemmatimonadaceae bacterium]
MRSLAPRLLALLLSAGPLACAAGDDSRSIVRDSAGIGIVENRATDAGWQDGRPWSATIDLTIGADTGGEMFQFGRIGDLAVLPSGDIAVIDQLAGQVRVFDRRGAFLRTIGRPGRGPGELSRSTNAVLPVAGDSLLLPDPDERRITVFAPDGTAGRVILVPPQPRSQSWARTAGGRLLMRGLRISRGESGFEFHDALIALAPDGAVADTLLEFDYAKSDLGGPGRLRVPLIVNSPSWALLADGRVAWTALDRNYVMVHDSSGRPVRRITHVQWAARPITPDDKAAMVELMRAKLRMIGGDPSFADSPQTEAPPAFPAITAVKAGPDGTIWVQRMGSVATIDPMAINAPDRAEFFGGDTWDVLDGDGRWLGTIELPGRFRIMRITDDAIYGAARDDDGVERVLRLRLRRG